MRRAALFPVSMDVRRKTPRPRAKITVKRRNRLSTALATAGVCFRALPSSFRGIAAQGCRTRPRKQKRHTDSANRTARWPCGHRIAFQGQAVILPPPPFAPLISSARSFRASSTLPAPRVFLRLSTSLRATFPDLQSRSSSLRGFYPAACPQRDTLPFPRARRTEYSRWPTPPRRPFERVLLPAHAPACDRCAASPDQPGSRRSNQLRSLCIPRRPPLSTGPSPTDERLAPRSCRVFLRALSLPFPEVPAPHEKVVLCGELLHPKAGWA